MKFTAILAILTVGIDLLATAIPVVSTSDGAVSLDYHPDFLKQLTSPGDAGQELDERGADGEGEDGAVSLDFQPAFLKQITSPDNSTLYGRELVELDERQKSAAIAQVVLLGYKAIEGLIGNIGKDKEARRKYTQSMAAGLWARDNRFNYVICHVKHKYQFDGVKGVDWWHQHTELDIKVGGTVGYEIYAFKSGHFWRRGDGGYLNWAYIGNVVSRDDGHVTFAKPWAA